MRAISLQILAVTAGFSFLGCANGTVNGDGLAQGGSIGAGGNTGSSETNASGGKSSSSQTSNAGGQTNTEPSSGGSSNSGNGGSGNVPSGNGGKSAGGSSSGGSSTSSSNTGNGGASTGGSSSVANGGKATGGSATGGASSSVAAGGKAAGGSATGGSTATATGGVAAGGKAPTGGVSSGGVGNGGAPTGGTKAAGGSAGSATTTTTTTNPGALDCSSIPAMPTGGTLHSGNGQGGKDNLAWQIWSNGGSGSLTTFSTPAFIAAWNNSGDYLGRLGYEWGNAGKAFASYGTITADLAFKKNGTAGQYSYVGIYGWSTNPCIEWYIVDDSYSAMPFNTGTAPSGTADLDGGTYNLVKRNTTGTGGNRCGNVTNWDQFYSIRKTGRQCGTISVTEHFKIWDARGWKLGNLLEVKILVEAASGVGSVDFSVANVKLTP